jgi:predicted outer membrane repeat protein
MAVKRPVLLRQLLLLLGVVLLLQQQQTLVAARATCKLRLEGFISTQGIKSAELSCSGGSITAFAHLELRNFTRSFSGVSWSDEDCGDFTRDCLLTLCGDTSATFLSAVVRNVDVSTSMLLCLDGNSNVTFEAAHFAGNAGRPITVRSPNVKLQIMGSNFTNNTVLLTDLAGGALRLNGGAAIVQSSVFRGNVVQTSGGAVAVTKSATIQLSSSLFEGNTGERRIRRCGGLGLTNTRC